MIPLLMERLKEVDPDFIVDWSNHEDTNVFQQAFVCSSATQFALRHNQLVVCLDACHTKNRNYTCQLFVAIVMDERMRGLILAYGIAPVENTYRQLDVVLEIAFESH